MWMSLSTACPIFIFQSPPIRALWTHLTPILHTEQVKKKGSQGIMVLLCSSCIGRCRGQFSCGKSIPIHIYNKRHAAGLFYNPMCHNFDPIFLGGSNPLKGICSWLLDLYSILSSLKRLFVPMQSSAKMGPDSWWWNQTPLSTYTIAAAPKRSDHSQFPTCLQQPCPLAGPIFRPFKNLQHHKKRMSSYGRQKPVLLFINTSRRTWPKPHVRAAEGFSLWCGPPFNNGQPAVKYEKVPLPFSAFIAFCKQRLQDRDVGGGVCFESERHGLTGSDAEQSIRF